MCGRFAQRSPRPRLKKEFGVADVPEVGERYNVAPTQEVLGVVRAEGARAARLLRWGLVPAWARDPAVGAKLFNARAETAADKPSFREAFLRRRCLVPADGFYEWRREGRAKQPYFFHMRDGRPFGLAGIWERWRGAGGELVESCAILTTEANELVGRVHDRMPVIVRPEDYELWLAGGGAADSRGEVLRPFEASEMACRPVSSLVNSTRNQGPELIEELRPGGA